MKPFIQGKAFITLMVFLHLWLSQVQSRKLDLAEESKYILKCDDVNQSLIFRKELFPNRLLNVSLVIFDWCAPPNVSYSYILSKLNINPSTIQELELRIIPSNLLLRPDHFKGLSLFNNINMLSLEYKTTHELDPEIFGKITVEELHLNRVKLKKLQKFRVKKTTLRNGRFVGEWGDCSTLKSLSLIGFNVSKIHGSWLGHCRRLTDMTIENVPQKQLKKILNGTHALRNLFIQKCKIESLKEPFANDSVNLRELNIDELMLEYISVNAFEALKNVEVFNITSTRLRGFSIFQAITPMNNLRKLLINSFHSQLTFCEDYDQYAISTPKILNKILGVKELYLRFDLPDICFEHWRDLTHLDLRDNKISKLNMLRLPVAYNPLIVNLRGNPLKALHDSLITHNSKTTTSMKRFNVSENIKILLDLTIECDCEHTRFVEDLRGLPQISLDKAKCTSGERLVDFTGEKFRCDKYPCKNCTCRTSWDSNETIVDCNSRKLDTLPVIWEFQRFNKKHVKKEIIVKKILATRNNIEKLAAYDYPMSLIELDLSNNKISHISKPALDALFFGGKRRVKLSGNLFVCECETQTMLDGFRMHNDQIPDYKYLNCINRDSYIYELSDRSLCAERALLFWGPTAIVSLLALAVIMTLLYFRYKLTIKAFLYARGLCLYCVREEELDADKEYDAFISFSGRDDELVAEELLPGLENDYKLCLHTRNWIPGEQIYTQIHNSVERSRRTIIVLTKNFVESMWGMVEFRTAYVNALREGRVRVICIMVDDDINDMDIPTDLKKYLKSNTYLKLRDPWFWQQLRYALPHPSVTNQPRLRNENE